MLASPFPRRERKRRFFTIFFFFVTYFQKFLQIKQLGRDELILAGNSVTVHKGWV